MGFYEGLKDGKQTNDCLVQGETMALSGVNKLCKRCNKECKQWKQVMVVRCPAYQHNQYAKVEDLQIPSIAESK